jgi:hypothetical protein
MTEVIERLEAEANRLWEAALNAQHAPRSLQLFCLYSGVAHALHLCQAIMKKEG